MEFGGHDHCYFTFLNTDSNVFICKSGCDFEEFTNLTVLFGVLEDDVMAYREQVKGNDLLNIHYSSTLKRLFIAEKVIVDQKFDPDEEIKAHVEKYTESLNEQLNKIAGFT